MREIARTTVTAAATAAPVAALASCAAPGHEAHVAESLGDNRDRSSVRRVGPVGASAASAARTIEARRSEPGGTDVTGGSRRGIGTADVDRAAFRVVMIGDDEDLASRK